MTDLDFLLSVTGRIYESDHWYSYDSMFETARRVENIMRSIGMTEVKTLRFPSDGVTDHGGWIMPPGWNPQSAELELILPGGEKEVICSYLQTPCSLMLYSRSNDVTAELALPDDPCLEGKLVLVTDHEVSMPENMGYFSRGAAGVLCSGLQDEFVGKIGQEHLQDACKWYNYAIPFWPVEGAPFGFSLSPRQGERLRTLLKNSGRVLMHARIEAEVKPGEIPLVTGFLPGETCEEILMTGHLFEQGANDNASGVAEALAVARSLAGRKHKRGLRLMFTHEVKSLQAYLAAVPDQPPFVAGLNADMVAVSQNRHAFIGPSSAPYPNYASAVLAHFLVRHGCTFSMSDTGGMDTMHNDPFLKAAMVYMEFLDDPDYHKSTDSMERLDPSFFLRTYEISREFVAFLLDAGKKEALLAAQFILDHEFLQPHPKNELPSFARDVLLRRIDSVLELVPPEEKAELSAALEPFRIKAAQLYAVPDPVQKLPEIPADIASELAATVPVKNFRGLFSFEKYWFRKEEFPDIASEINGWHAGAWIELAFMWADGSRNALEIWQLLAKYGRIVEPELFYNMMKFMLHEGFLVLR